MHQLARFIYFQLMGWTMNGVFPEVKKCVVIVVPHTSWLDFPLGLLARRVINKKFHYVGKKSLFRAPYGWYFRWLGGAPVDRSKSSDMVSAIAKVFDEHEEFRFALAPEGTRKKVANWKTGFYYIAHKAGIPIVMVAFDYGKKEIKISQPITTSGNYDQDWPVFREFFRGVKGRVKEYSFEAD